MKWTINDVNVNLQELLFSYVLGSLFIFLDVGLYVKYEDEDFVFLKVKAVFPNKSTCSYSFRYNGLLAVNFCVCLCV